MKCQHCLLQQRPKCSTCEGGSRKGREFCSPEPQLWGWGQSCSTAHEEIKQSHKNPSLSHLCGSHCAAHVSRACQDIFRPLELNWKNVGELCNYNHNIYSGLYYCSAGGGENEGQQREQYLHSYQSKLWG